MRCDYDDPFELLEERHVMSVILYLHGKENVTKGQIYAEISRGNSMPDKLTALERCGIIDMGSPSGSNRASINLTEKGRNISESIRNIRRELSVNPD